MMKNDRLIQLLESPVKEDVIIGLNLLIKKPRKEISLFVRDYGIKFEGARYRDGYFVGSRIPIKYRDKPIYVKRGWSIVWANKNLYHLRSCIFPQPNKYWEDITI